LNQSREQSPLQRPHAHHGKEEQGSPVRAD
jgi:hypothetical protein